MRFRTRAFLLCFVPFAVLFAASFWMAQKLVQSTVRNGLLASLRQSQLALAHAQAKADLQTSGFLKITGESPELKSEMELLQADSPTDDARQAMEDQLRSLGEQMGFDLVFVSAPDGTPLAGVVRQSTAKPGHKSQLVPLQNALVAQPARGMLVIGDRIFQFTSVPIDEDTVNIGTLSVGEYFDLHQPGKPAVLVHDGEVIDFNLSNVPDTQIEGAQSLGHERL